MQLVKGFFIFPQKNFSSFRKEAIRLHVPLSPPRVHAAANRIFLSVFCRQQSKNTARRMPSGVSCMNPV
jgi:hypothetical protein